MKMKYKVYRVDPRNCYRGYALIAAETADEANAFIKAFQEDDKNNRMDSWGYDKVDESDVIDGIWAENKGFVNEEIYYYG